MNILKVAFSILCIISLLSPAVYAEVEDVKDVAEVITDPMRREISLEGVRDWSTFHKKVNEKIQKEQQEGEAYMLSGGLLLIGGVVGYHNAHSSVEKLAFSIAQSLGVSGIGYGSFSYNIGGEERSFLSTVNQSNTLTEIQKNQLARNYVNVWYRNRKQEKLIKMVTHSLVAALNIYNGINAKEDELKAGLYVLGGVNLLAALSLSLTF